MLALLASGAQATDNASPALEYARTCLAGHGMSSPPTFVRVRRFGANAATSSLILELIRSGEKSGTFTTPALYAGRRELTPVVGDLVVVTDFEGRPGAAIRTTAVRTVPFNEVTEAESGYDGPSVRPLAAWRRVHWAYFTRELAPLGLTPVETMPVTVEQFELLCSGDAGPARVNRAAGPQESAPRP